MSAVLAIETSNPSSAEDISRSAGVALRVEGSAAIVEPLRPRGPHHDDLMGAIDRVCARASVKPRDLRRVIVSIGPGGYTSLRIAVATAKMLCEATGARCAAVPSAQVAARRVDATGPIAVALASKHDAAWVQCFELGPAGPRALEAGALRTARDLESLGVRTIVADRFLPATMAEEVARLELARVPLVLDPAACLEAGDAAPDVDPLAMVPLYAREAEAVVKWRSRQVR